MPAMHTVLFIVLAMNWEGHDDWMKDHPSALELERQVEQAAPLPPTPCGEERVALDNPYEQVPLRCGGENEINKREPPP